MLVWTYLITKACEVGCGTTSAPDTKLTASGNFGPDKLVYVCSVQVAAISPKEAAISCARFCAVLLNDGRTACTFEGELDSFACTCTCLFPKKTRCRNLELSLALHSNEAGLYKAIN